MADSRSCCCFGGAFAASVSRNVARDTIGLSCFGHASKKGDPQKKVFIWFWFNLT